jgi:signal transduction histidine kinase
VRWPRLNALWITLGVLAVLLVLLAALQYRWLGDLGRGVAERRQSQLERAASRFQWAFDRELGQALFAFRPEPGGARDPRTELAQRLADLQRRDPDSIVSGLLLLSRTAEGVALERCDDAAVGFLPAAWLPGLDSLRDRLLSGAVLREGFRPAMVREPPGFAFPILAPAATPRAPAVPGVPFPRWGGFTPSGFVVVVLDDENLRLHLLPALAQAHFGPLAESEFVVAVTRRDDGTVLYSSDPTMTLTELGRGDARRALPSFEGRGAPAERHGPGDRGFGRRGPGDPAPGDRDLPGEPPGPREPDRSAEPRPRANASTRATSPGAEAEGLERSSLWVLVVRHRGGSLEKAVASVRQRNLAIGFGILALLGTAGAVLAVSAQRAQALARQQIEFVAGVTHEINTPLAAIRSAGQNLADGIVTEPAGVKRYGQLIEREGSRLAALVAQALDFAGIASSSRAYAAEPVAVAPLVDEALGDLRLVLEQGGFTVEKDVPAELPPVRGDAAALRRVITNLVANATKFAAAGRWVGVRAARGAGGRVVLRVEDRGPGIDRDERERVFDPFYRGRARERNDTPGAGLGLSLVRHVVRAHGGEVRVEARDGGGAAIVVELPAAEEPGRAS